MDKLTQIKETLKQYEAYYPCDGDLWPNALRTSIENCKWLVKKVDELKAELALAAIKSTNEQFKLLG